MPQSLHRVIVHLIFSTKDRRPFLNEGLRPELYSYIATVARNIGCNCYRVGGVEDHLHAAIALPRTETIATVVEKVKTSTSRWVKGKGTGLATFGWQRGYACFSVSPKDLDKLCEYIDNQQDHHRARSFQDELRALLERYGVDYDERYVWD